MLVSHCHGSYSNPSSSILYFYRMHHDISIIILITTPPVPRPVTPIAIRYIAYPSTVAPLNSLTKFETSRRLRSQISDRHTPPSRRAGSFNPSTTTYMTTPSSLSTARRAHAQRSLSEVSGVQLLTALTIYTLVRAPRRV
jgi:hypothetical protein